MTLDNIKRLHAHFLAQGDKVHADEQAAKAQSGYDVSLVVPEKDKSKKK